MIASLLAIPLILSSEPVVPDYLEMQSAYNQGTLEPTEYLSLILNGMENPESLPEEFLTIRQGRGVCLTTVIRDAIEGARQDPRAQDLASRLPFRPPKQASFVSPNGLFTVHYDTTGYHAVHQPDVDVDPVDGVPDYVNRCAEIFDHCWHVEVDSMGFYAPGSDDGLGGSDNYDVYLHRTGAYGVTYREGPASEYDWDAWYSHIHVDPTYDGFGYIDRLDPLKVTAAHEFQHACQFSYDGNENGGWMEQCATWMEDVIYDDINDYVSYISSFFDEPHRWLYSSSGLFQYGACVWPHYLAQNFGIDIIEAIWEECRYGGYAVEAVDIVLQSAGSSRSEAVADFRAWNFFTGTRDDGQHYEEGSTWPQVRIMKDHYALPVLDGEPLDAEHPAGLACNYVRFNNLSDLEGIRVHFADESIDDRDWIVPLMGLGPGVSEHETLIPEDGEGTAVFEFENASTVVMVPTCVSVTVASGDYSYWARDILDLAMLESITVEDFLGDHDGRPEEGEEIHFGATFVSTIADWDSTAMIVRSLDPDLEVVDSTAFGGSLAPGGQVEIPSDEIVLSVISSSNPHGANVRLLLGPADGPPETYFDTRIMLGTPPLLVYDDDGGGDVETFVIATLDSLVAWADVWDEDAGIYPGLPLAQLELTQYDVVVWLTGDAGNSIDGTDIELLTDLFESNTHLLLSGQDIAESLATTQDGQDFLSEWLGVQYDGRENLMALLGPLDAPLYGGMSFATAGYGLDGANNQTSRDRLAPNPEVDVCLEYQTGYPAAVRRDFGTSRLLFCGFGVEAIVDDNANFSTRREFFAIALDYLQNGLGAVNDVPLPEQLAIRSVWPNPAARSLNARLLIPAPAAGLRVSLMDIAGRAVTSLPIDRRLVPGEALVTFRVPKAVSNGSYFLTVQQGDARRSVPVTILR